MPAEQFPSKIILFGEYVMLLHSHALAVPYSSFSGKLKFPYSPASNLKAIEYSNKSLTDFYKYILQTIKGNSLLTRIDLKKFNEELKNGIYFDSSIPVGYGIGSSGAITAAVYNRYVRTIDNNDVPLPNNAELKQIKDHLAYLESFFHSRSSGIDPLVSYLNKPLLIKTDTLEFANFNRIRNQGLFVFLVDTNTRRDTGNLVKQFLQDCQDPRYIDLINNELLKLNEICIDTFLQGNIDSFYKSFLSLSKFQFQHFRKMIPVSVQPLWQSGLQSENFGIKLCGSGGGGYMLAFTLYRQRFFNALDEFRHPVIEVDI
jgi:mevalonate kinase